MRELHLFAGVGGGILAGKMLGHRCIGAVEIDPFCQKILRERQQEGLLDQFPIESDVRTFDGRPWRGMVDVLAGGFPCQPWSAAGKRRGVEDPRHLWPDMARIVAECRPRFVFAENNTTEAFRAPFEDLQRLGYRIAPLLNLSASQVGAHHRRSRYWLLAADADHPAQHAQPFDAEVACASADGSADADSSRLAQRGHDAEKLEALVRGDWWASEPRVGRVAYGVPSRMDRIRSLGEAQVPAVAAAAFRILMEELCPTSSS